jgi:hypothetical protein
LLYFVTRSCRCLCAFFRAASLVYIQAEDLVAMYLLESLVDPLQSRLSAW